MLTLWGLIGLLATIIIFRQGDTNQYADFNFPNAIPLQGWTLTQSQSLSSLIEMQIVGQIAEQENSGETVSPESILAIQETQEGSDIFMSGQRYQYQNHDRSAIIEATFRYIVNVSRSSDLAGYYKRQKTN